jgi:hypothetical protein
MDGTNAFTGCCATIRMRTCDDQDEKRDRDFGMLVGQFVAGKA